jgi:nucleotide-binding universal stress UspA family protein
VPGTAAALAFGHVGSEEDAMHAGGRPVVVGIDGSEESRAAARFAAQDARGRGAPLVLVHALTWPFERAGAGAADGYAAAAEMLSRVADGLTDVLPADRLQVRVEEGDAVAALSADSATAELVAVGSRGAGRLADLLLGSTASAVAACAGCPVVVVPSETTVAVSERRSVVVGVAGRGEDDEVLAFAVAEAAVRGTDLLAVHAWQDSVVDPGLRTVSPPLVDWAGVARDEQRVLAEAVAGWREKEPDVDIREVVVRDRTAPALIGIAATAELLVVGRRPHPRLPRLGSVAHAVLHRAPCPVAVVPIPAGHGAPRG